MPARRAATTITTTAMNPRIPAPHAAAAVASGRHRSAGSVGACDEQEEWERERLPTSCSSGGLPPLSRERFPTLGELLLQPQPQQPAHWRQGSMGRRGSSGGSSLEGGGGRAHEGSAWGSHAASSMTTGDGVAHKRGGPSATAAAAASGRVGSLVAELRALRSRIAAVEEGVLVR